MKTTGTIFQRVPDLPPNETKKTVSMNKPRYSSFDTDTADTTDITDH